MIEALRRVPYFAALPDAQIQQIARHVRTRSYETGEVILVEDRPCEGLYFVIRGHVRLWHVGPDGREQVLRVLGPGRPFNDVAVFDEGANPDNVTAAGACVVGSIPRTVVRTLVENHPEVASAALRLLAARQRSLGHIVEGLARRDVVARVASLLLGCAGRHDDIVEGAPEACARITHEEIAAMVGSVREVVQRALKDLEAGGRDQTRAGTDPYPGPRRTEPLEQSRGESKRLTCTAPCDAAAVKCGGTDPLLEWLETAASAPGFSRQHPPRFVWFITH